MAGEAGRGEADTQTDAGQVRLKYARVLLVGVGGLGCPAAAYLAGAGVGTIGLVDHDTVEVSNLHRQILHSTAGVGMGKVDSAIKSLRRYARPPTRPPSSHSPPPLSPPTDSTPQDQPAP